MKKIETDILVLGSGIAGLSFAIKAATLGNVAIVTKAACSESNTRLAQGGIACVWDKSDNFQKHIEDTLIAGDGHCKILAVETVIKNAPNMIRELMELGINFNKANDNSLELGREGGHSNNRIVHINDESGLAVVNVLLQKARSLKNIKFYEHHFAIDLIKKEDVCAGAFVWDIKNKEEILFNSRLTILATGGAGKVYEQTTNPEIATGDGFAMAYNIGAKLADMEFVQFHPTSLFHPKANGFLISEALRGFGAELVLHDGKSFMQNYHPSGSLAPRDIVSRAIFSEMQKHNLKCLYLDARSLPETELRKKFPSINQKCFELGIDISNDLIPVVPAAHYLCGGVVTDINGLTNINNLYALGEVACTGLHGANRLASNSLLEGLVFAEYAFQDIKNKLPNIRFKKVIPQYLANNFGTQKVDGKFVKDLKHQIGILMWKYVGIMRKSIEMKKALLMLKDIGKITDSLLMENNQSSELLELRNIIITAKLITLSALNRSKSLGTHFILAVKKTPENQALA